MAKLLKIGVEYFPNYSVTLADGTKKSMPCVMFFFDSDSRTASMVAGSGVAKGLKAQDDTVTKLVKVDKYKDFLYGKNVLPKILSEFEKLGYSYDTNNLGKLEASVEQEIQNVLNSDSSSKIYSDNSSFIDDIIEAMEKNINDPKFMSYVNAVGSIQYVGDDTLSKVTKLSTKNTIMVLSQWVNAGNQGAPTFLATKRQWSKFFNRDVIQGATPLYAVTPKDTQKRSLRQTMSDYGISQQKYDSDAMVRKQVDTLMNDKDYGNYNNASFGLNRPYYDYSQTVLQAGATSNYDFDSASNIDKDKNADDDSKRGEILQNALGDTKPTDETKVLQNILDYAQKTGNNDLTNACNSGLKNAIEYMAKNSKTVLRGNDVSKNQLYEGLIVALVLKRLKIYTDYSDRLIMNNMRFLRQSWGMGLNKQVFHSISSDFENIIYIANGITESASVDTLMWVINALGISPDEYKNMPRDEKESEEIINGVKESFIRTFNNMLKYDLK